MPTKSKTVLRWTYTPGIFFEEPCCVAWCSGTITISDGLAVGEFDGSNYDRGRAFRDEAHDRLIGTFLAQQVQTRLPFSLSAASMYREHQNGHRDILMFAEPIQIVVSVGKADFTVRDADGNVIRDTRIERLTRQERFRSDVAALWPADLTLKRILESFQNALSDRANLFIHLNEIRETLATDFGGHKRVFEALDVSSTDWKKFGRLANNEPLLEGRHRGKHETLRSASKDEIEWALGFAQRLVEAYVSARNSGCFLP